MTGRPPTPGQTIGPFFGFGLPYPGGELLVPAGHPDAIRLHGRVLDGAGDPVPDALVEVWQPGPDGVTPRADGSLRRDGWTFTGWGRAATNPLGEYSFTTLRPARAHGAPFFALALFARGILDRLFTRAYLPGDDASLAAEPLLAALPVERRGTLVAREEAGGYTFDLRLQGPDETVFLRG